MLALRLLWRIVRWLLTVALVLALAGVIGLLVLRVTNPKPKTSAGWELGLEMPIARGETASAMAEGQLVVTGGLSGITTVSNRTDIYDVDSGHWSTAAPLPRGLHHAAATAIGHEVYLSGGARSVTNWEPSNVVLRLRGSEPWRFVTTMPEGRQGHAMVTIGDKLYIVGGIGATDDTLIYDISENTWTRGAPLPGNRDHLRAVVQNGHIWAIGGRHGKPTARVDVYFPSDDKWIEANPLPEPMSAMAVGVINGDVHVVGSEDPRFVGGGVSSSHYVFRAHGTRWKRLASPPLAVHGPAYGVWNGTLVLAGGASRNGALSIIAWTDATQLFTEPGKLPGD